MKEKKRFEFFTNFSSDSRYNTRRCTYPWHNHQHATRHINSDQIVRKLTFENQIHWQTTVFSCVKNKNKILLGLFPGYLHLLIRRRHLRNSFWNAIKCPDSSSDEKSILKSSKVVQRVSRSAACVSCQVEWFKVHPSSTAHTF